MEKEEDIENKKKGIGGKMKAEGFIDEYLEKFQNGADSRNYEDGCMLIAIKQMYDALGDEKYFSVIDEYLKHFVMENGCIEKGDADKFDVDCVGRGRLLFFMYDKTGEEKYRNAIEAVMDWLREHPEKLSPAQVSLEDLYMVQPFYMEYETRYDKKAKYSDIIGQFEKAQNYLNDKDGTVDCIGLYLMALIDALDGMSFEIYEKYRKLQDMFKLALTDLLKRHNNESGFICEENAGNAMIAYAIIKACRMGILLKEKYAPVGMGIVEKLMENNLPEIFDDARARGVFVLAYGQYLQLKAEMEA